MMRGHHFRQTILLTIMSMFLICLSRPLTVSASSNPYDIKPVISDELHILSRQQKNRIKAINKNIMKKSDNQQIWVITTNKVPAGISRGDLNLFSDYLNDYSPSVYTLRMEKNPIGKYYAHKFGKTQAYMSDEKKFDPINYAVINIIYVNPKSTYQCMPIVSAYFKGADGDFRNSFLTLQLHLHSTSSQNVMNTVEVLNKFINKHLNDNYNGPGLSFNDFKWMVFWGLLIFYIIKWFVKHWNTGFGPPPPPNDGDYDNGYMDGYYIGMHENDDKF